MAELEESSLESVQQKMVREQKEWSVTLTNVKKRLYDDVKVMVEVEAESISQIQILTESITSYSLRVAKSMAMIKRLEKDRFEHYALGYKIKTTSGEKTKLIDADLSSNQHFINIYEIHIEFLRETKKNFDNIRWAVKNKIELYNQLGIS